MFPHEAQATMAKFLFMLFAILILLLGKMGELQASDFTNACVLDQSNVSH